MTAPQSRINEFRGAVVNTIKAALPNLRECSAQFGRFDLDQLETTSVQSPAVRVGILKSKITATASAQHEALLSCAAFAVTDGKDRDNTAWAIAEAVSCLLATNQMFGLTKLGTPTEISIQPVISAGIRSRGAAIIAVEWQQQLRQIGENIFDDTRVVRSELYVSSEPEGECDA
ncbi:hypothetical protein [Brucella anthropi]|uniref:hypothetical protein n=1 Tax=Brucella anthropi TaxID=529 RepID=UPI00236179A6|nr:hypothetical protein [Brucella anthropi]